MTAAALDRQTRNTGLLGSLLLHGAVFSLVGFWGYLHRGQTINLGDVHGGGPGSVAVDTVDTIPLPRKSVVTNRVANDTPSPAPAPVLKQPERVKTPPPDAIPIKGKTTPKPQKERQLANARPREYDPVLDRVLHSSSGPVVSSPMIGRQGSNDVSFGNNNPFGNRFGAYAAQLRELVSRRWQRNGLAVRPVAVVSVQIMQDGSTRNIELVRSSGDYAVDSSARRALADASPFPPLPPGFGQGSATVEFSFQVTR